MRLTVSILALLAASPSYAEDVFARADIAEAVVYFDVAQIVRRAALSLPPGSHRVLVPAGDDLTGAPPILNVPDDIAVLQVALAEISQPDEGALDTAEQGAARRAVEAAEQSVSDREQELRRIEAEAEATFAQLDYLDSLIAGGEGGISVPRSSAELTEILLSIGDSYGRLSQDRVDLIATIEAAEEALEEAEEALELAEDRFDQLRPLEDKSAFWAINLELAQATDFTLELSQFAEAGWRPSYEMKLDSESGALSIDRQVTLFAETALPWSGVDVTLSATDPMRALGPAPVFPSRAGIGEIGPARSSESFATVQGDFAAPLIEPVTLAERESPIIEGLAASYEIGPVSIEADQMTVLELGGLFLQADLINRAVPRVDDTAFLIAHFENTTGEAILPGDARFFRDGALVGESAIDLISPAAETELPFGPFDQIQLTWTDLSRDTGDSGVFVSSNTQEQRIRLEVENLGAEPTAIELLYPTPFSEQEDLEIDISASTAPDETSWEDLRGVYAWQLELPPASRQTIELNFSFRWPEGQQLIWRP